MKRLKVAALPQLESNAPALLYQPFDRAQDEQSTTTTIDYAYDPLYDLPSAVDGAMKRPIASPVFRRP